METEYYLFLDDEREPRDVTWVRIPQGVKWTVVRNYTDFVDMIERRGLPKFIAFDHDLGFEHYQDYSKAQKTGILNYNAYKEKTGYDAAKWLVNYCINHDQDFPNFEVHSMNVIGKINIQSLVNSFRQFAGYNKPKI